MELISIFWKKNWIKRKIKRKNIYLSGNFWNTVFYGTNHSTNDKVKSKHKKAKKHLLEHCIIYKIFDAAQTPIFFNLITGLLQYSRLKGWNNCGCNTQTNRCYKWFSKLKQNIATEQIGFLFWYSKVYKVQTFPIRNINYTSWWHCCEDDQMNIMAILWYFHTSPVYYGFYRATKASPYAGWKPGTCFPTIRGFQSWEEILPSCPLWDKGLETWICSIYIYKHTSQEMLEWNVKKLC